jgi:hypothetical protein
VLPGWVEVWGTVVPIGDDSGPAEEEVSRSVVLEIEVEVEVEVEVIGSTERYI